MRKAHSFSSTCCYCGVGCGVMVHKDKKGNITVEGDAAYPVNKGMLCSKGLNLHYTVNDRSDRLLYPQMRYNKQMPLQRVSWDSAIDRAAAVFKALINKYGPDSVAFYISGQCLTEEYYVINKLMKGFIGANNVDSNSRLCMSSAVAAYKKSLGEDSVPLNYSDIEEADCFFITGANPAWCHPILWRRVEAHKAANPRVRIIVSDPRQTDTAALADCYLPIRPGTDIILHHAIGRILIEEGNIDAEFIKDHTEGFAAYKEAAFRHSVEEAASLCGLTEKSIRQAAGYLADASGFISMWTMGLNQSVNGVDKILSLINLHLATGHIGRRGSGPFSLTGQPNAMGGREAGGLANLLPAHMDLFNPVHREKLKQFWNGADISPQPGLTATEIFEALDQGRLKAVWIIGTNPLISLPDVRKVEAALKKAKFVVVQEISNKPETLAYADLVLPAAGWAEKEGTMTNSERRISYLHQIVDPPGEALPDAAIICRMARKMGFHGFDFQDAAAIYKEYTQLTKGSSIDVSGLSHDMLRVERSVQWPWGRAGVDTPFRDRRFSTPSGRARFHAVSDTSSSEAPDPDFPLILTTGRIRDQWHTMTKTGKVNKLKQHIAQSFLEIHPEDARPLGIADNDLVQVNSRRGDVRVKARYAASIRRGVVFMPMHWGKVLGNDLNRVNNLTNNLVDPVSKEPDFKFSAVRVVKYRKPKERIVVVGAGAGAFGFIQSYRLLNKEDEIIVFSKEDFPFYDRVQLPDYVSGVQHWQQLIKMSDEEESKFNIRLHRGVRIETIHREEKYVVDSRGITTYYDKLLLATGSRAAVPKNIPALEGIFTMRSRLDADRFKQMLPAGGQVVVAGGGLLGLEMAASLREIGIRVSVIHRSSRFLDRQLDVLASQLLHEEIIDQGCDVYYSDEVQLFYGHPRLTGIRLKSGRRIDCDALIFAIGTVPNAELAVAAGLQCQRGVIVNEYMRTSDPNIFAVGEIAEFNGKLYGFTAAAEQQAAIFAGYLHGDISQYYRGTTPMSIIKIHGFDLCCLGIPEKPNEHEYEEIVFIDLARRYYKKCIVHQDRLVGAILVGDKDEFLEFRELISGQVELNERRLQLLRSGRKAEPLLGRLVCSCNHVGSGNIENKIASGCTELEQICAATGAGTGCGSCRPEIKKILEKKIQEAAIGVS